MRPNMAAIADNFRQIASAAKVRKHIKSRYSERAVDGEDLLFELVERLAEQLAELTSDDGPGRRQAAAQSMPEAVSAMCEPEPPSRRDNNGRDHVPSGIQQVSGQPKEPSRGEEDGENLPTDVERPHNGDSGATLPE